MMTLNSNDYAVLAYLRGRPAGQLTIRDIAAATGLKRVTLQACLHALVVEDLICIGQHEGDRTTDRIVLLHVHPVSEEGPGGIVTA